MTSLIWYTCVAVLFLGAAVFAIYKNRRKYKVSTVVVFYIFTSAVTWICEFIVLGFFNSYAYKTEPLSNIWEQNLIGHLFLNTTMYPAAATIMLVCSLKNFWIYIFTFIFVAIEYLFIQLGLYEQHWWRYYISVIVVITFLFVSRYWYFKMNQNRKTRTTTFYFVALLIIHFPSPLLLIFGKQYYRLGIIENMVNDLYRASIIFSFIYHLLFSFLAVLLVCLLRKWYWKLSLFIISIFSEFIFLKLGILVIHKNWSFIYTILAYEISIAVFILLESYALKQGTARS